MAKERVVVVSPGKLERFRRIAEGLPAVGSGVAVPDKLDLSLVEFAAIMAKLQAEGYPVAAPASKGTFWLRRDCPGSGPRLCRTN